MKRTLTILAASFALGVATLGSPAPAMAEEAAADAKKTTGLYGSVGVGAALWDEMDTTSFTWRAQFWWRMIDWFAAEVEWVDLDKASNDFGAGKVRMAVDGFNVSAMPILPIGDSWTLFGKVGCYFWDADFRGIGGGGGGQDLSYGAGTTWEIAHGVGLRAEWTRFDLNIGKEPAIALASFDEPVDVLTVGGFFHW